MKDFAKLVIASGLAGAMALGFISPTSAQLLSLGGSGGGGSVGGDIGGAVGDTVDSVAPGGVDAGTVTVPRLLDLGASSNRGGTNAGATLLGGGGNSINIPLGETSGARITLPGLGGIGGPGGPGAPGDPGAPGAPGANGGSGANGVAGLNGNDGAGSARMKALVRILENRAWMRFALNNRICLPSFGVTSVAGWIRPSEYGRLQQVLAAYGSDISQLQQMMKKCSNGQNRLVDVSRVIGVDLKADGQIVVMTI